MILISEHNMSTTLGKKRRIFGLANSHHLKDDRWTCRVILKFSCDGLTLYGFWFALGVLNEIEHIGA